MFQIGDNIDAFERSLSDVFREQLPFAMALALNDTGFDVIEAEQDHMKAVFDKPVRWTLNAFRVSRASKRNLIASVERKTVPGSKFYLEVQNKGGARGRTGIERKFISSLRYSGRIEAITPAKGVRLTASGNVSRATWRKIMGQVGKGGVRSTSGSRRVVHFVPKPSSGLSPGVYERRGRKIKKVMHFTKSRPRYDGRFDFERVAEVRARKVFPDHLNRRLKAAVATRK